MVGLSALPRTIADARAADTYIPPLLSTTEVARRLGISRQAVTQRLAAGTLPGRRAGNTWVVAEADIPAGRAGDDTGRRTQQGI
ncbi:helix-turn-helix domain-containing protein [Actinobaculum suis]